MPVPFAQNLCRLAQGREKFGGREIVANELKTENLGWAKDKEVLVIGGGKSALDVAGAAAEVAKSVTLLVRQVASPIAPSH